MRARQQERIASETPEETAAMCARSNKCSVFIRVSSQSEHYFVSTCRSTKVLTSFLRNADVAEVRWPTEANPVGAQTFDDVAAKSPRRRYDVAPSSLRRRSAPLRLAPNIACA